MKNSTESKNIYGYNVIIYEPNKKGFICYDIIPYFIREYKEIPKTKKPKTYEEFKNFIISKSIIQFWSRCQYEIVLTDWPCNQVYEKIDVHGQIMNNIDIIVNIVINSINNKYETN